MYVMCLAQGMPPTKLYVLIIITSMYAENVNKDPTVRSGVFAWRS